MLVRFKGEFSLEQVKELCEIVEYYGTSDGVRDLEKGVAMDVFGDYGNYNIKGYEWNLYITALPHDYKSKEVE